MFCQACREWSNFLQRTLLPENVTSILVSETKITTKGVKFVFYRIDIELSNTLCEKCPNTEFFLVHIFLFSD